MRRTQRSFGTALALAVVLGTSCDSASSSNAPAARVAPGPGISLPSIDGEDVELYASAEDEIFVLTFWATWCQPCQSELSKMDAMYQARKSRGLRLYGISIDGPDTVAQVPTWSRREGYSFPVLLDGETEILGRYNPKGDIPFYVVIDAQGRVLKSHQSYVDGDVAELSDYLDGLLRQP